MNLFEKNAPHQRAKYIKYKKLNKDFSKKNSRAILDDPLDNDFSSSSESHNFKNEDKKTSIDYDSDSGKSDYGSNSSTNTEEEICDRVQDSHENKISEWLN